MSIKSQYQRHSWARKTGNNTSNNGLSLIEPIIASILLSIVSIQLITFLNINSQARLNTQALDDASQEIEAMVDTLRNLGTSYNWCAAAVSDPISNNNNPASFNRGGQNVADCAPAVTSSPRDYYSPASSGLTDFINRCLVVPATAANDKIVANLNASLAGLGNADAANGVKLASIVLEDFSLRRFKIRLERTIKINGGNRTLIRWFYLIPDLAGWCPS